MASTELTRNISSTTNRKTGTLSAWVKLYDTTGTAQAIFSNLIDGNNRFLVSFESGSILKIGNRASGTYDLDYQTNRVFRDSSAWYHIVVAVDTTQATSGDRVKLWVNGVQETSFSTSTAPSQNSDTQFNLSGHDSKVGGANKLDGLLAHVHWIDGTAYDASTFGETDANGVWKPKTSPSVTYGTNGFFLKFENSGSMGTDSSPNGNNFTVNGNLTQTVDTPSNVYATLNPLMLYPGNTVLANGNTSCSTASGYSHAYSTLAVSTGKWYWEAKLLSSTNNYFNVGIMDVSSPIISTTAYPLDTTNAYLYAVDGNLYQSGGSVLVNTGTTVSVGDIVGFYLDLDNGTLKLQKNGSNVYSGNAVITGLSSDKTWCVAHGATTSSVQFNFGNGYFGTTAVSTSNSDADSQGIFEYSPTLSGVNYYALNTKNLATYG